MEEIILETKELCKQYHKQTVLKNINMRIPKGCVYGLLGANGAGKSTLMKILCGMTRADAGEVFFDGKIWSRKCIERIGALIELPPVYENLSAVDNLKVRTWTLGISDARILEVLDIVDLKNTGKKQVGKFSMGMKQRLGIAVALLNDPDFLILDEPANGLDPFGIRQLREMLVSFAESGMTILSAEINFPSEKAKPNRPPFIYPIPVKRTPAVSVTAESVRMIFLLFFMSFSPFSHKFAEQSGKFDDDPASQ